jgi:ELWxxDGT repeat protein
LPDFYNTYPLTLFRTDGTAGSATVIADLGRNGYAYEQPGLVVYNGAMYFQGNRTDSGKELWRSDGTPAGTGEFIDLNPGPSASNPGAFVIYNGRLYFRATTPNGGSELHSTDGTVAGTTLLKDIMPGGVTERGTPTIFNGRLYFQADDIFHGAELWSTDGTSDGTMMLEDIDTDTNSFNPSAFTLGPGGLYYFTANDGVHGTDLWKTDGTAAGTSMVKDLGPGGLLSTGPFTFVNGLLLFAGTDSAGRELWRSDGTDAGTVRVKDIAPGASSGLLNGALVKVGNRVFFAASTDTGFSQDWGLWVSDGTEAGTQLVKPPGSGFTTGFFSGAEFNGKLIFHARSGTDVGSIYISDGTPAGTTLVKDGFRDYIAANWTPFNGKLYFTSTTYEEGNELWSTDGTTAGTVMVADINPEYSSSSPDFLVATPDYLYFAARDASGPALWRIDKATSTLSRLASLFIQQMRASASGGVILSTPSPSNRIYRFDGTNVIVLKTSGLSVTPNLLGSANGLDYFSAGTTAAGVELWMTDGTSAGTVMVQDLVPGPGSSVPQNLSVIDGSVYVSATTPATGRELFVLPPFARLNADGSLTLEGTESSDVLSLNLSNGNVTASLFSATLTFPAPAVTNGVHVIGGEGTSDALGINGGTFHFNEDLGSTAPHLSVSIAPGADAWFHSAQHLDALSVSGSAHMVAGGGNVLVTKLLVTLQSTGRLDLADNAAIVDYTGASPIDAVRAALLGGYNSGAWNGHGITSSVAATIPHRAVGFAEATDLFGSFPATFAGESVDSTAVLLRYTIASDANFDGVVDTLDFNALAANFGGTGKRWSQADFNYDGMVNTLDFNSLAAQFGKTLPPPSSAPALSAARGPFSSGPIIGGRSIGLPTDALAPEPMSAGG